MSKFAYETCPQLCEFSLLIFSLLAEEIVTHNILKDGIPEKLKSLI